MSRSGDGSSRTRVTGYAYQGEFDESKVELVLEEAREAGVVVQYDTGRGSAVWFNGRPGPELRALRERVKGMIVGCRPWSFS